MYKFLFIVLSVIVVSSLLASQEKRLKWEQTSHKNIYNSELECQNQLTAGSFQKCSLKLFHGDKVVESAKLFVKGGMPAHAHGLPTSPKILWSEHQKAYLIEGLKFSMPGQWLLRFNVNTADILLQDTIELTIEVN